MQSHCTPDSIPIKQCTKCNQWKPATAEYFELCKGCSDGTRKQCKVCRGKYKKETAERRIKKREANYDPDAPVPLKQCTGCGEQKPATVEYFSRDRGGQYSLRAQCKVCGKAHRVASKERAAEYGRAYYAANKEKRLATARAWQKANKEQWQEYNRTHRAENKEHYAEKRRAWLEANPDYMSNYNRAYLSIRRTRERNASGSHTAADIKRQYKNQKGKCYYCGVKVGKGYHVDHVIPLSRGGSNGPENLVIACPPCNLSKKDKMPHEWRGTDRLL